MNTINNKFSFARLGAVLRCDLVEHRWSNIAAFFIYFAAFLSLQLTHMNSVIDASHRIDMHPDQFMPSLAANFTPIFYVILALALMCAAADMCGVPLKTKGRGLNYLMMPATNMEKFIARVLVNTILLIVMAFAALLLADLVRMLFVPLFEVKEFYGFTIPRVLSEFRETFHSVYMTGIREVTVVADGSLRVTGTNPAMGRMLVVLLVMAVTYVHSLFLLGGCFWRKRAIIKIWLIQMIVGFAIVWTLTKLEPWFEVAIVPHFETGYEFAKLLSLVGIIVLPLAIALNWWLSYRLFSRKQVVAPSHWRGGKHLHEMLGRK